VWFWAAGIAVVSALLLWGGTQIGLPRGQDVNWHTGFGQRLEALASLIAPLWLCG
jgi:hypothetical protein